MEQLLNDYGLQMSDLTPAEKKELEEEIKATENGEDFLDGVLCSVERRKSREVTAELLKEIERAEE